MRYLAARTLLERKANTEKIVKENRPGLTRRVAGRLGGIVRALEILVLLLMLRA